jgi:hypothetical protein
MFVAASVHPKAVSMSLVRRPLLLGLGAVGVLGVGAAGLWTWLGGAADPMRRVRSAAARLLPPGVALDADAVSEGPEGMVFDGMRLSGAGTEGRAVRAVVGADALRLEGVEMQGGGGVLAAKTLVLSGIDWERGLVRAGEAEEVAIADAGRLGGVGAARARLLGWSDWVPTRVELERARLAVRGGRAAGLDVAAASVVLSLDPGAAGAGDLALRWVRALSAAALREASGRVADLDGAAAAIDVRLVARDAAGDPSGVEIRADGLDLGGAVASWRAALLYGRIDAEVSVRAVRGQDGAWRADAALSWPLAGAGEATLEAVGADGVWPDLRLLRWRRLAVTWRDAGLVRRVVEQARGGQTTSEAAAEIAGRLYGSGLLEGVVSARLDLERWLEEPGVVRLELSGEGAAQDLVSLRRLERPTSATVRLSLR